MALCRNVEGSNVTHSLLVRAAFYADTVAGTGAGGAAAGLVGLASTAIKSSARTFDNAFWALRATPQSAAHKTKMTPLGT